MKRTHRTLHAARGRLVRAGDLAVRWLAVALVWLSLLAPTVHLAQASLVQSDALRQIEDLRILVGADVPLCLHDDDQGQNGGHSNDHCDDCPMCRGAIGAVPIAPDISHSTVVGWPSIEPIAPICLPPPRSKRRTGLHYPRAPPSFS